MLVLEDEDEVEPGEDGGHQIDIFIRVPRLIPATQQRIRRCQHGAPRVQRRNYARFCYRYRLLLHRCTTMEWHFGSKRT